MVVFEGLIVRDNEKHLKESLHNSEQPLCEEEAE